ncbi:cation transport ATPase [Sphingobium sp. SYK-6]|uniref:HAD-IC family P-type ATPase n=1 Tax=Sphingobium sp. (strain NBRC 103272 / SYK-6) TaxID=627192 RepID=UPI0002277698|nr:HAD-IC family P-type ATPase [Sphingobium sp. SYK-6]BAK67248.1 cation transport ATPase [Sphingobium sp. SYK-6]
MPAADLFSALGTTPTGLSSEDAQRRLAIHGPNVLPAARPQSPIIRFLRQFHSALIYFLLAGGVAATLLGHLVDAAVILAVVLVNATVGFIQEGKAEQALDSIRDLIAPHALTLRDGVRTQVGVRDLVPGDIVLLEAGDRVPADMRLLRARGLLVDEAALTGESVAAEKHEGTVEADAPLGDRSNMTFSGTLVAAGQGTGVVVETGIGTEIGRISKLLQSVEELTTPLLRQIEHFARHFTAVVLVAAVLLFAFAVLVRGFAWDEALIFIVALAVGVIPEGLPAVITITLAIGVRRMAARNAVIRKLPAVETLGATSVICSDKTGTLTRNEMTARQLILPAHRLLVGGAGYAPEGEIIAQGTDDDAAALDAAMPMLRCGLLCNDAHLRESAGHWMVDGDPMEGALVALAMKAGLEPTEVRAEWPRIDEIPFDAAHRFMASLHRSPTGEMVIFVKGAPEALFAMAKAPLDLEYWNARIDEAAGEGERLLAFGALRKPAGLQRLSFEDVAEIELLGLIGFIDPPRPEAVDAIAQCRSAGIDVKMITGDHAATALAIGRQLGIADDPRAVTGAQIEDLSDGELADLVRHVSVFARTSPEHKLRIVRALQADGAIVAMTGDGVNDAPSLKQADVGTAMGRKGTEAAKEAAQMVLLDDNFASIVNAVHEGRTVYDNIRKVTAWTIPTNGGEALIVILAIFVGFALPMTATQILWVNLILGATLGLALAFEPSEPGVMRRPPRKSNAPLLSPFLLWRVVLVSLLFAGMALGVFFLTLGQGREIEVARTMVVNMVIVGEIFYLFNVRYLHVGSITWRGMLGTPVVLAAIAAVVAGQLAFTYLPVMNEIFGSRPLAFVDGALIIGIGVALLLVLEMEKRLMRRLGWFEELAE